jgi:hypothetical protein
MAGEDIVMVRQKELKRLDVIRKMMEGTLTQRDAAGLISLTARSQTQDLATGPHLAKCFT